MGQDAREEGQGGRAYRMSLGGRTAKRELGVVNKVEGRTEASENSQRGKELEETVPRRKPSTFKC